MFSVPKWELAMHWRMIGPFRGGRTRAATGVPSQPNVFYAGQGDGGVWKSDDYGRTWNPIFDAQPRNRSAPSRLRLRPQHCLCGSGEGLCGPISRSATASTSPPTRARPGQHLGLRDGQQIPALAVDPRDPNKVFAAVLGHPYGPNEERGIYRSTDGGADLEEGAVQGREHGGPMSRSIPPIPTWSMHRCGRRAKARGKTATVRRQHGGLFKSTDGGTPGIR
jgi:hypothetical protein